MSMRRKRRRLFSARFPFVSVPSLAWQTVVSHLKCHLKRSAVFSAGERAPHDVRRANHEAGERTNVFFAMLFQHHKKPDICQERLGINIGEVTQKRPGFSHARVGGNGLCRRPRRARLCSTRLGVPAPANMFRTRTIISGRFWVRFSGQDLH